MYFLIDPVRDTDDLLPFAEEIVSAYDGGVPVAIASVVKAPEDSEVTIGSKEFHVSLFGLLDVTECQKRLAAVFDGLVELRVDLQGVIVGTDRFFVIACFT